MKNTIQQLVFVLLIGATTNLVAQDVIVKRDNSKIEAKIIEVHEDEIHYKKFSNLEGPTYVIETANISSITYENGEVEEYTQVKEKQKVENSSSGWEKKSAPVYSEAIEMYSGKYYYHNRRIGINQLKKIIYSQGDIEAIEMWKSYKAVQGIGYGIGFASIPLGFVALLGLTSWDQQVQLIVGGGGFLLANVATCANIVMRCMYKNKRIKAVELYNDAVKRGSHEEDDYY